MSGPLAEVEEKVLQETREILSAPASPDGVLLVDKAPGMTSHDVVAMARRRLKRKRSAIAARSIRSRPGCFILTLGRGTKIQDLLMAEDKEYVGTMTLGVTTDSQDRRGQVVEAKRRCRS